MKSKGQLPISGFCGLVIVIWFAASPAGRAQAPAAPKEFAVAVIKPSDIKDDRFGYRGLPGGELIANGVTLKLLLMEAYDLRSFQVSGGPAWVGSERWDIDAKPEGVQGRLSSAEHAVMLRALLEDRFQVKVHKDVKELSVYALLIGKGGPKLSVHTTGPAQGGRAAPGAWDLKNISVAALCRQLSRQLSRTVIDQTNLGGNYDIKLQWTPDFGEGGPETLGLPPAADTSARSGVGSSNGGASIFSAIQEQLGLRLESTKGPVEILTVDHAERPSAN